MAGSGMKGWHDLVDKQIKRPLLNLHIEPHRSIIDKRINPHGFIGFKLFDDGIRAAKEQIGLKAFGINPDIPVKFRKRDSLREAVDDIALFQHQVAKLGKNLPDRRKGRVTVGFGFIDAGMAHHTETTRPVGIMIGNRGIEHAAVFFSFTERQGQRPAENIAVVADSIIKSNR